MVKKIYLWLTGNVKIKITGFSTERFINLCKNREIEIWGVKNYGKYQVMLIKRTDFPRLKPILHKTKTKVVILKKYGLPFFIHKYRKRKLFFAGIIFFVIILYVMSLFIWNIQITGNYSRTTELLTSFLKENGIEYGMQKKKVKCEEIETLLRENFDDITWASARMEGTSLILSVKESEESQSIDINDQQRIFKYSDIIADEDGTVASIITRNGNPYVKKGDTVSKGQILISGAIPVVDDNAVTVSCNYVDSDGDVRLITNYQYLDQINRKVSESVLTGKIRKDGRIKVCNYEWNLDLCKKSFKKYQVSEDEKQICIAKHFFLPVMITIRTYSEYKIENRTLSEAEAKGACYQNLEKFIVSLEEKGIQILSKNVKINVSANLCELNGTLSLNVPQSKKQSAAPPKDTVGELEYE